MGSMTDLILDNNTVVEVDVIDLFENLFMVMRIVRMFLLY
jgi:hypothetical protein